MAEGNGRMGAPEAEPADAVEHQVQARQIRVRREQGFVLLDVLMSLMVITIVLAAFSTFYVGSLQSAALQNSKQPAIQLASSGLDYVQSLRPSTILKGRSQEAITKQWAAATGPVSKELKRFGDAAQAYDSSLVPVGPGDSVSLTLPLSDSPTLNGVQYTRSYYVGYCHLSSGACDPGTDSDQTLVVWVALSWSDPRQSSCTGGTCWYVLTSLVSIQSDADFSVGVPTAAPSFTPTPTPTATPKPSATPIPTATPPPTPIPMSVALTTVTRQWVTGTGVGTNDRNVYIWGDTRNYLNGTDLGQTDTAPTKVTALTAAVQAATCSNSKVPSPTVIRQTSGGGFFSVLWNWFDALDSCGYVWGVGDQGKYAVGNSRALTSASHVTRVLAANTGQPLSNMVYISSSDLAGAGVRSDGTVWVWGDQGHGGGGDLNNAVQVTGLPPANYSGKDSAVYLQGGHANIWIILQDGNVWSVVGGVYGLPAGANVTATATAMPVAALNDKTKSWAGKIQKVVSGFDGGGAALLNDGTLLAWTNGGNPTLVTAAGSGFIDIHSSDYGYIALKSNGDVWIDSSEPQTDGGPQAISRVATNVVAIYAGFDYYYWEKVVGTVHTFYGIGDPSNGSIGFPYNGGVVTTPRLISWASVKPTPTYTDLSMLNSPD